MTDDRYGRVWRAWKLGSLLLFAAFVWILNDIAKTVRRYTDRWA